MVKWKSKKDVCLFVWFQRKIQKWSGFVCGEWLKIEEEVERSSEEVEKQVLVLKAKKKKKERMNSLKCVLKSK